MADLKETAYKGCNNPNTVSFNEDKQDGAGPKPIPFSVATRYLLLLVSASGDVAATVDTDQTPGVITGNDDGDVVFDLKDVDVPEDDYYGRLKVFDPLHPDGQIIVHEDKSHRHDRLILAMRDA